MKKVLIEALLIEEANEVPNEKIIKDLSQDLKSYPPKLTWIQKPISITIK